MVDSVILFRFAEVFRLIGLHTAFGAAISFIPLFYLFAFTSFFCHG